MIQFRPAAHRVVVFEDGQELPVAVDGVVAHADVLRAGEGEGSGRELGG